MAPDPIPDAVLRFLRDDVASVRELETLLALREAATTITAQALARDLRSGARWTEQQLEGWRAKGLACAAEDERCAPGYRYAPSSAELAAVVDAVSDLLRKRRSTVIRLIFADTEQDALRTFADAFRLRRGDED